MRPTAQGPRYPLRDGVVPWLGGDTDRVLGYMSNHGVTSSNAFCLGAHAHSDHIDNADDIIQEISARSHLQPRYSDKVDHG